MRNVRRTSLIWLVLMLWGLRLPLQVLAQDAQAPPSQPPPPGEIDQLVAPIALYPDPLLAQVLMASTYPLEIVQAARWSKENPNLKEKALEDALQQQPWDPSVKSLTAFPQVITMMNEKIDWTQKLGDAFLASQGAVMDGVQRLRAKAQAEGNLASNAQQTVTVEQAPPPPANVQQNVNVEQQPPAPPTIIKVEPANPQVVYVPTYNPSTAYGAWPYPAYPPYSYYPPGYLATSVVSFGLGMAAGAALWGNCNWGGGWGNSNVNINTNNYNNFNKTNVANGNWQHNVDHRKGVQYRDSATQQRYGRGQASGAQSREQFRGRAEQGRQDIARGAANDYKGAGGPGDRGGRDAGQGRGGAQQRDQAQRQGQGQRDSGQRQGQGQRDAGQRQGQAQRDAGQRQGQAQRDAGQRQGQAQRDAGQRQGQAQRDAGRSPGAYQGVGNGQQTRAQSDRGQASRQSAAAHGGGYGGGGGRGGGGGGYSGGGGGRGGGGGGGRGGGGGGGRGGGGGGGRGGGGRR